MNCRLTVARGLLCVAGLSLLASMAVADGPAAVDPAKTYTQAQALQIGWPQLAGPLNNFQALPIDTPLVEDLRQAKRLWESDCADLGRAKGGSQAFRRVEQFTAEAMAKHGSHPGSWAGVIVGDGLVYAASWRPAGEWVTVAGNKVRLDAEDFVVAIDPLTGKTKWQTFEAGGILKGGGKRQGFQVGPVYANGVVYSLGSTAMLYAHDAKTGRRLWSSEVHPARESQKKAREEALAALAEGKFKYALTPNWCASMAMVGGVLVVPDQSTGLIGVDPADGMLKWRLTGVTTRWATPAPWRSGDREYLLAANDKGELRLIDPGDGKELWTLTGLGPNWSTLTPGRTHVLVNVVAGSGDPRDGDRVPGRYGAVRLSPTKGEKTWEAPEASIIPVWMDTGARNRVMYSNGRFLIPHGHASLDSRRLRCPAYLLDEATGKVLSQVEPIDDNDAEIGGLMIWCGQRLLTRADSFHGPTHGGRHPWIHWSTEGNTIVPQPGSMDLGEFTNAYEVPMEVPLVGGLMFERTEKGTVVCYDLRARK